MNEKTALQETLKEQQDENTVLVNKVAKLELDVAAKTEAIAALEISVGERDVRIEGLQRDLQTVTTENTKLKLELNTAKTNLAQQTKINEELKNDIEEEKNRADALELQLGEKTKEKQVLETRVAELEERLSDERKQAELDMEALDAKAQEEKAEQVAFDLKIINDLQAKLRQASVEAKARTEDRKRAEDVINDLKARLEQAIRVAQDQAAQIGRLGAIWTAGQVQAHGTGEMRAAKRRLREMGIPDEVTGAIDDCVQKAIQSALRT